MFFKYAIVHNRYFSIHIVLAEVLFLLISLASTMQIGTILTFAIAIVYEVYRFTMTDEWLKYKLLPEDMARLSIIPDSIIDFKWRKKRYWLDSVGDVIAAFIGIVLVMIMFYFQQFV